MGSVANNCTWIRIGYRIYSLWRLQLHMVTITVSTTALVASRIPLTELHCADVSLRVLTHALTPKTNWRRLIPKTDWRRLTSETDWRRLTPKADGRGLTNSALCCLLYITLGRPDRKPGLPTVGCYATNTGHPTVGCHATQQYRSGDRIHVFDYGCLVTTYFSQTCRFFLVEILGNPELYYN
jgi:hypothetical protein